MSGGLVDCPLCQGLKQIGCPTCGGSGIHRMERDGGTLQSTCATCHGNGVCQCTACQGTGVRQILPF